MSIPESIARSEFLEALKPLGSLLGVDMNLVYLPFVIEHDGITFAVDADATRTLVDQPECGPTGAIGVVTNTYSVRID